MGGPDALGDHAGRTARAARLCGALYGKWHLGGREGRYPTDQGFEEWYGIPHSSNEAQASTTGDTPYIWEGRAGEPSRKVKVFDLTTRRTLDREAVERGVAFMTRNTKAKRPFFLFLPLTQVHFPTLPHHDFAGKTAPAMSATRWRKWITTSA